MSDWLRAELAWCRRPMYLDGGGGGHCERRRGHPGVHCRDPKVARAMDEVLEDTPWTWAELFPEGREVCYEGDGDPWEFARSVREACGFDPAERARGSWERGRDCWFWCPSEHLDLVYGSGRWEIGS